MKTLVTNTSNVNIDWDRSQVVIPAGKSRVIDEKFIPSIRRIYKGLLNFQEISDEEYDEMKKKSIEESRLIEQKRIEKEIVEKEEELKTLKKVSEKKVSKEPKKEKKEVKKEEKKKSK